MQSLTSIRKCYFVRYFGLLKKKKIKQQACAKGSIMKAYREVERTFFFYY